MSMNITIRTFPAGISYRPTPRDPGADGTVLPGAEKVTERMVGALDAGLELRAVIEIFIQSALYSGLRERKRLSRPRPRFAARGISLPDDPEDKRTVAQMDADGAAVMEKLHGPRQAGGYARPTIR